MNRSLALSYVAVGLIGTVYMAKTLKYDVTFKHCVRMFIFTPPRLVGNFILDITNVVDKSIFG